jgi:hypothetical protein
MYDRFRCSDASARGQGAAYIVLRGRHASLDQTDLNMCFRLIIIGGGGSFRKLGPFGTKGSAPPPGRSGWGGPPLGPLRPGGSLILLDASFLGAKPR